MTMWKSLILFMIIAVVGLSTPANAASSNDATPSLSFGIVPQQSAAKLAETWGPFLKEVSERSGVRLVFKTAPNIPEFERRLAEGDYDVAYMNPYHYVVFHQARGYRAIARERRQIQGLIVVRKDSEINDIKALDGQTLAFPSPAAFAASVLPRAALRRNGVEIMPKYVNSHDSVYLNVVSKSFPAGGGIVRTFNAIAPETSDQLRVLWRTPEYSPHAIAAHPRVDESLVKRVVSAMGALADTDEGRALLNAIGFTAIIPGIDADWDDIRSLEITPKDAGGL
jgi:phosphonate transport system substrate-binding protein